MGEKLTISIRQLWLLWAAWAGIGLAMIACGLTSATVADRVSDIGTTGMFLLMPTWLAWDTRRAALSPPETKEGPL